MLEDRSNFVFATVYLLHHLHSLKQAALESNACDGAEQCYRLAGWLAAAVNALGCGAEAGRCASSWSDTLIV